MKFQYQGWLKFFDNSDVTEETNDCTQYYCYNPAKLLSIKSLRICLACCQVAKMTFVTLFTKVVISIEN